MKALSTVFFPIKTNKNALLEFRNLDPGLVIPLFTFNYGTDKSWGIRLNVHFYILRFPDLIYNYPVTQCKKIEDLFSSLGNREAL